MTYSGLRTSQEKWPCADTVLECPANAWIPSNRSEGRTSESPFGKGNNSDHYRRIERRPSIRQRLISCVVSKISESGETEYLSLILGIPWLYSVNVMISIRESKIMVGDSSVGEPVREVIGPELEFCKDHNLLMYPKSVMNSASKPVENDDDDSDTSDSSESGDEISDVEEDLLA